MRGFEAYTEIASPGFAPGDIVVLKSGGPDMTVTTVDPITGDAKCWWMNTDCITDEAIFPWQSLALVEEVP